MILTIRTDKPEAEIRLFDGEKQLARETWHAHRQLAETIHIKIKTLLDKQHKKMEDLTGIIIYKGPGSFTGLRIGISVANALAYGLDVPIVATTGENWISQGLQQVVKARTRQYVVPEYGSPAKTTKPRK